MRTSGRGRAEAARGTYSRRLATEKAKGLSGPFFCWSPSSQLSKPRGLDLVIRHFIRLGEEFHQYSNLKKKYKSYITKRGIRRLNFPDSGPNSAKGEKKKC